jgi:hypothetical protein
MGLNVSLPLFPSSTSPLLSQLPSTLSDARRAIAVPIAQIVLFTNFMSQHSVWTMTLKEIEVNLQIQANKHKELAEKVLKQRNIKYRRIFFASTAVHGFRTGGLTPGRQRWLNQKVCLSPSLFHLYIISIAVFVHAYRMSLFDLVDMYKYMYVYMNMHTTFLIINITCTLIIIN